MWKCQDIKMSQGEMVTEAGSGQSAKSMINWQEELQNGPCGTIKKYLSNSRLEDPRPPWTIPFTNLVFSLLGLVLPWRWGSMFFRETLYYPLKLQRIKTQKITTYVSAASKLITNVRLFAQKIKKNVNNDITEVMGKSIQTEKVHLFFHSLFHKIHDANI
jgi:hypothetical protein